MAAVDLEAVRRAQDRLLAAVGDHPDVNGVGIALDADGAYVLKVNLRRGDGRGDLPAEVDGVPVRAETIGPVRKRPAA
jgi:hypothetical protein